MPAAALSLGHSRGHSLGRRLQVSVALPVTTVQVSRDTQVCCCLALCSPQTCYSAGCRSLFDSSSGDRQESGAIEGTLEPVRSLGNDLKARSEKKKSVNLILDLTVPFPQEYPSSSISMFYAGDVLEAMVNYSS